MKYTLQQLILEQLRKYPNMQIEDLLKFLHQSTFGCGHLIDSPAAATEYLQHEMQTCQHTSASSIEPLDGGFCRVHLTYLRDLGISSQTFARLFVLSANAACGTRDDLCNRLNIALQLADARAIPFSRPQLADAIEHWTAQGFPAMHHSARYREAYAPAYRVLTRHHAALLPLLAAIDHVYARKQNVLLAIDGNSGAGKSTLSALLQQLYDCNIFHMDDFFLRPEQRTPDRYAQPGGNVDHERFLEEVLLPLSCGKVIRHRKFNCSTFMLTDAEETPCKSINIIEGVYSMHPELEKFYDLSVFLKIDPQTQRRRINARDGAYAKQFFEKWIPLENSYFSKLRTAERCDLVFDVTQWEL